MYEECFKEGTQQRERDAHAREKSIRWLVCVYPATERHKPNTKGDHTHAVGGNVSQQLLTLMRFEDKTTRGLLPLQWILAIGGMRTCSAAGVAAPVHAVRDLPGQNTPTMRGEYLALRRTRSPEIWRNADKGYRRHALHEREVPKFSPTV